MVTTFVALVLGLQTMGNSSAPLKVVDNLDPARYVGEWFEIARLPNRFQNKCAGDVVARYTARPEGGFTVVNRCRELNGRVTEAEGVARTVAKAPSSVLQVRFAPAFLSFLPQVWGDYQVIALDNAHTHALVGTPDRKYLWVLSRAPLMDDATYDQLIAAAARQGFDVAKVVKTPQRAR
jgi:apolipoprotein D and lipocalin family protein